MLMCVCVGWVGASVLFRFECVSVLYIEVIKSFIDRFNMASLYPSHVDR